MLTSNRLAINRNLRVSVQAATPGIQLRRGGEIAAFHGDSDTLPVMVPGAVPAANGTPVAAPARTFYALGRRQMK